MATKEQCQQLVDETIEKVKSMGKNQWTMCTYPAVTPKRSGGEF